MASEKYPIWSMILYPENMLQGWEDVIGDRLQLPYAYAVHDQDLDRDGESRKIHVHLIVVWHGPTTRQAAIRLANRLSAAGRVCCSTAEPVADIRHMYDYLIHDTDDARKKGKWQYHVSSRICGNNFDIGCLEQLSSADKTQIISELRRFIYDNRVTNFAVLDMYCGSVERSTAYCEVLRCYTTYFQRLVDGVFQLERCGYFDK